MSNLNSIISDNLLNILLDYYSDIYLKKYFYILFDQSENENSIIIRLFRDKFGYF